MQSSSDIFSRMVFRIFFSLFLSFILAMSNAQAGDFVRPVQSFNYLTTIDGFESNTIWKIHQDATGFVWFGTKDGLYKYDGSSLQLIRRFFGNNKSNVTFITENKKTHTLWLTVENNLFSLDLHTEQIKQMSLPFSGDILCTFIDNDSKLWISSSVDGIYTLDSQDDTFHKMNGIPAIAEKEIVKIDQNPNGVFSFLTSNQGIVTYDYKKNVAQIYPLYGLNSTTSLVDSQKRVWVGTWNGLYLWDNALQKFKRVSLCNYDKRPIFGITKICEKNTDELYISTDSGLFVYNFKNDSLVHYKADPFSPGCLKNNYINDLFVDKEKTLWIATYFGGVNYMTENSKIFLSYDFINTQMEGHVVSSFAEDYLGNLWIATDDGGLSLYNKKTHQTTNYNPFESPHPYIDFFNIHALQADSDNLYIGMSSVGLNILNLKEKTIKKITTHGEKGYRLHGMSILTLTRCSNNELAIGTTNGLDIYQTKTGFIEHIDFIPNKEIHKTIEDRNGNLWTCGPEVGVFKRNAAKEWINFNTRHDFGKKYKITTVEEGNGRIYFGTQYNGVICYDPTADSYENLLSQQLASVVITCIIHKDHNLWIGTTNGLYSYDFKTKKIRHYSEQQGIKSKHIYNGLLTKDGTLFFGTTTGLNGFRPENLIVNSDNAARRTVFTKLRINNENITVKDDNSLLSKNISYTDEIILSHNQSNISVYFSQLSYTGEKDKTYRYRLSPIDKEWEIINSNHLNLKQLPTGNYTLEVMGKNEDGTWNKNGSSLMITILPPWWATWQMYTLYVLLFFSAIIYFLFLFKKKQERRMKEMEIKKKNEIYRTKMTFFTHVIHDIRTPLTLILAPLEGLLSRNDTRAFKYELEVMSRNGNRLLKNVNQLIDFQKMEQRELDYGPRDTIDVVRKLTDMKEEFSGWAESKSIAINLQVDDESSNTCLIEGNKELFDKIFTNLLSNALKFSTNRVNIKISKDAETCVIAIEDNGPGISKEFQTRIFEPFFQIKEHLPEDYIGSGIGLSIVKKAIDKMGGTSSVISEPGKGTAFYVSLPIGNISLVSDSIQENTLENNKKEPLSVEEESGSKWKIAIAEDNTDMRNLIVSQLSPYYQVCAYTNGQELLDDKENTSFDLILSDVMMPVLNGYELCGRIKENSQTCHLPVILLTAKIMEEDEIEGLEHGADAYIRKPFSQDLLLARIRNLIKNRQRITATFIHNPDVNIAEVIQSEKDKVFIEKLNTIIEKNMDSSNLSAQFVASELSMCRALFFSKIKAVSGLTFTNYVRVLRLKKAVELMKTENYSLLEISTKVGFSSLSYFSKCFKQQFNISPSEYQKQHCQEEH